MDAIACRSRQVKSGRGPRIHDRFCYFGRSATITEVFDSVNNKFSSLTGCACTTTIKAQRDEDLIEVSLLCRLRQGDLDFPRLIKSRASLKSVTQPAARIGGGDSYG